MKILFDTSVWVDHLRGGTLAQLIPQIRGRFWLRFDAVSAAELSAGCRDAGERRVVSALLAPFRRADRVLTPIKGDFERAGRALSRLRSQGVQLKNPGAALLDGLIATVAVRQGCLLVACNIGDFQKLASVLPLHVETLTEFRLRL